MLEPSGFREIARSAKITYPIPFILALLLAFDVLVLGGAILANGPMQWALFGIGMIGFASGLALLFYSVLKRPDLLRTERYEIASRMLDLIEGDSDLSTQTINSVANILNDEPRSKRPRSIR